MKDEKSKLARWACLLDEFSFTIEHYAGKDNKLPDALSRHPAPNGPTRGEPDLERMLMPTREKTVTNLETTSPVFNALGQASLSEEITAAQQLDPIITREVEMWQEVCNKEERTKKEEDFAQKHKLDIYGFWKKHPTLGTWSLRVPASSVENVLCKYHDDPLAGQPGCDETLREIQSRFYWPEMRRSIRRYVSSCHLCTCCKPVRTATKDTIRPRAAQRPWETVTLNSMGPYPPSSQRWDCDLWTTPNYHPWAIPSERRNQDIKINIRLRIKNRNHRTWDRYLPKILCSLRRRQNAATKQTPSQLLLGWTLPRPGDWRFQEDDEQRIEEWREREERARQSQQMYQQRYANQAPMPQFHPGEQIYMARHFLSNKNDHFNAGFAPWRTGPHTILEQITGDVYVVDLEGRPVKLHANQLYRAHLPIQDKNKTQLPSQDREEARLSTQGKKQAYLPTSDNSDLPDGEQPQGNHDHCDETPTCSKASSTLKRDLPQPPGSGRQLRPTNRELTSAQPCASTRDDHNDREPARPASRSTLSWDLPLPPSNGRQPQPTNHELTGA